MPMKTSRWLCAIAGLWLGAFGFLSNVNADNPPWPPQVLVLALDPSAAEEGSDPATFLVVRVGPANAPLTVQYALGGTADNGADYQFLPGMVTIPTGAYFAPVTVDPIDDFLVEGSESVVIALQQPPVWPPPYIVTWPSVAAAEIADNDFEPTNRPPSVALVNPPDGAIFEADDDILLVARAHDSDGRVRTVEFFDGNVSLGIVTNRPLATSLLSGLDPLADPTLDLDGDLFPVLDLAPIPPGGPIPIPVPGDLFRLMWSNPSPGRHVLTAVATDNDGDSTRSAPVHITVLEPPPCPVVTVRATDPIAAEPDPTGTHLDTATFKIHRRGPTNAALTVFYRLGGTASNGVDYAELPHSVEIPAGDRAVEVVVRPIDDALVEGTESVILKLVPPICITTFPPPADCYVLGRANAAKAAILDNDSPPNHPPVVRLVKPEDGEVFLAPADIRLAALARDYDGYVTTVEFFEGTNSLGVVSNNVATPSPVLPPFTMVWSNVPPGHYVLHAVATDNDGESSRSQPVDIRVVPHVEPPVVNITAPDPIATEPGVLTVIDPAVFEVTRTGSTASPLVVFYDIGGTASNGVDYQLLSGRVLIPAGAPSANIIVNPLDDNLVEGLESVVLKLEPHPLVSPTNITPVWWYRIGSNNVARAVIRDNDFPPTNCPPRVAIVRPEDGDVFEAAVDIKLLAAAQDPDGHVRTVEFFDGTNSLGTVTNSLGTIGGNDPGGVWPEQLFRLLWQHAPPGLHILTAKATDNDGASSWSAPVRIRVLPPPRPPVVTIYASDPFACEGPLWAPLPTHLGGPNPTDPTPVSLNPKTATFTVFRRGETNDDLTVFYRLEGTAINGVDYRPLSGQVTIPRGSHCARIVVDPIDDKLPEPTETVVAVLVPVVCPAIDPPPPGCYIVGDPHRAVAYIFDNDGNLSPKAEIVHPQAGDIYRPGSDIEIDVAARDPDGWVGKVEFFANNTKIGEQEMLFIVPPPPGLLQKFSMVWSNVPAGLYTLTARATDNLGAVSLTDPVRIIVAPIPPVPVVTIEAVDPIATEPTPLLPAFDSAKFKVTSTGGTGQPLTVHYRVGGTASNGVDYMALSGVVTIPSNSPAAFIEVIPLHDTLVEGTESVIIGLLQPPCVLSNTVTPNCYLVGVPGRDVAWIRDNDAPNRPPTVAIVSPPNGAVFGAPLHLRLVAAAGDPDGWVTTVEFFDGSNSLGVAHSLVVILDTAPVRLSNVDPGVLTDNTMLRPFSLIWSNVPPGRHILTAVATDNLGASTRSRPIEITVRGPNDLPVVRIMAPDAVAREGTTNTATFRIRRTGPTNDTLTVFYAIHGTASNGVDYVTIPNSLTIPAGRRGARIVITPIDDNLRERIETVLLRLVPPPVVPPTYEIGRPARAGVVILDNDWPLHSPELLDVGGLHLRMPALPGMPFRLEATTNLVDWEEVASDINGEDGVSVVDDDTRSFSLRFYRVVPDYDDPDED